METKQSIIATVHDYTPATKADVESMITNALLDFHQALVDRGQIRDIPPKEQWPVHAGAIHAAMEQRLAESGQVLAS